MIRGAAETNTGSDVLLLLLLQTPPALRYDESGRLCCAMLRRAVPFLGCRLGSRSVSFLRTLTHSAPEAVFWGPIFPFRLVAVFFLPPSLQTS